MPGEITSKPITAQPTAQPYAAKVGKSIGRFAGCVAAATTVVAIAPPLQRATMVDCQIIAPMPIIIGAVAIVVAESCIAAGEYLGQCAGKEYVSWQNRHKTE